MPEYLQHNDEGSAVVGLLHNLLTEAACNDASCLHCNAATLSAMTACMCAMRPCWKSAIDDRNMHNGLYDKCYIHA